MTAVRAWANSGASVIGVRRRRGGYSRIYLRLRNPRGRPSPARWARGNFDKTASQITEARSLSDGSTDIELRTEQVELALDQARYQDAEAARTLASSRAAGLYPSMRRLFAKVAWARAF